MGNCLKYMIFITFNIIIIITHVTHIVITYMYVKKDLCTG